MEKKGIIDAFLDRVPIVEISLATLLAANYVMGITSPRRIVRTEEEERLEYFTEKNRNMIALSVNRSSLQE